MFKYEKEYNKYKRKEFVEKVSKKYQIKKASADRLWRKYKKIKSKGLAYERFKKSRKRKDADITSFKTNQRQNEYMTKVAVELNTVKSYFGKETYKPSIFKMLTIKDMKRFNVKLTDGALKRYGFSFEEIAWLKETGQI